MLQLASQHSGETAQQFTERMEEEVHSHVAGAEQNDDITLLVIKWNHSPFSMSASMSEIGRLQSLVENASQQAGISTKETKRLRLAIEEAVANIINHGEATAITIQTEVENNQLVFTITDDGVPFDPTAGSKTDMSLPPDQRPPGGLGMSPVDYRLMLTKDLPKHS